MEFNTYIGLPYLAGGRTREGVDCYGLVRLFYLEQLSIGLPLCAGLAGQADPVAAARAIQMERDASFIESNSPQDGDVILSRNGVLPVHLGIFHGGNRILHISSELQYSASERIDSIKWTKKIVGYYRFL